jgi:hypothetical protein
VTHYLGDNTFLTAISHGWGLTIRCNACKDRKHPDDKLDFFEVRFDLAICERRPGSASIRR